MWEYLRLKESKNLVVLNNESSMTLSVSFSMQALQTELLRVCEGAASVGQTLIDSTRVFSSKPDQEAAVPMLEAAHAVLQATMTVSTVSNYI